MSLAWSDLYGEPQPETPLDEGGQALLNLVPEAKRAMAEPMLRGYLATIQVQLGFEQYLTFTKDLKRIYDYHVAGDTNNASLLAAQYGLPYESLVQSLTEA